MISKRYLVIGFAAMSLMFTAAANAKDDFFQGKTMTIIVSSGVGGGFDTWARLAAPFMRQKLGLASVKVVNKPGGGGLIGSNAIYGAKPDGLTIGDTNAAGDYFAQISQAPGVKFDVRQFGWLGRPDGDPHVIAVRPDGPYQSFHDLLETKRPIKALAVGKGAADYSADAIIYSEFGIPFKMVAAFKSSHAEKAVFLSGEGDTIPCSASCIARMGSNLKVVLVVSTTPFDREPDVPTVMQAAREAGLPAGSKHALKRLAGVMSLGHAFVAPPHLPAARLTALRDAFQEVLEDPAFQQKGKEAGLYLGFVPGDRLAQMVDEAYSRRSTFKHVLAHQ